MNGKLATKREEKVDENQDRKGRLYSCFISKTTKYIA
jgi:hypothetical protein|tara:strand:- start:486 stop:596 length:111 start_codon:yes stop_codon:yes gene_type:complete